MDQVLDRDDRSSALDAFAAKPQTETTSLVPAGVFAAPAERVFGAQPVAVRRDEGDILKKLKTMAAAAGEDWYYRFPVRKKIADPETGEEKWGTDYIEGPSIKCANNVSRLYGNCDVDVRVFDAGTSWMFYARFMDLETGYSLVRPFSQRKNQKVMKTDAGRQEDIVFQIGASKAIRNVINNALEFFTNYAADEAKNSIIEKVGKKIDYYRDKIVERLTEIGVDIKRVELMRGRASSAWLAADIARTIAEIQAVADGMATAEETWPSPDKKADAPEGDGAQQSNNAASQQGTNGPAAGQAASGQPSSAQPSSQGTAATSAGSEAAKVTGDGKAAKADAKAGDKADEFVPTTEAQYIAYANNWRGKVTDPAVGRERWKNEKNLRNKCNLTPETRDDLKRQLDEHCGDLEAAAEA